MERASGGRKPFKRKHRIRYRAPVKRPLAISPNFVSFALFADNNQPSFASSPTTSATPFTTSVKRRKSILSGVSLGSW